MAAGGGCTHPSPASPSPASSPSWLWSSDWLDECTCPLHSALSSMSLARRACLTSLPRSQCWRPCEEQLLQTTLPDLVPSPEGHGCPGARLSWPGGSVPCLGGSRELKGTSGTRVLLPFFSLGTNWGCSPGVWGVVTPTSLRLVADGAVSSLPSSSVPSPRAPESPVFNSLCHQPAAASP